MANKVKKILILAANPKTTSPLRLDEEVREINEGLRRSKHRDQFEIRSRWAISIRDLRRALLDVEPQIVHFTGHGKEDGLLVENELGMAVSITSKALSGLFKLFANQVECVLLNACYSEAQANAISQHIDYVIGMREEIDDKAAIEFAVGFYDALGAGKPVEEAFKFGCNAIQLFNIPGHLVPRLLEKRSVELPTGKPPTGEEIGRPPGMDRESGVPLKLKRSYDVPGSNVDRVHFSIVSPASVMSNTTFEIELYAHLAKQRQEIIKRAREVFLDRKIKIKSKGPVFVSRGVILNVRLDIQVMKIENPEETILWEGEIGNASFLVHVPEDTKEGTYKGKAIIFINGIQAARLLFMLNVGASESMPECLDIDVKRYKSAFTSYASKDRETVLNYIHGMMKVCPELKFNMDMITLRSGEKFNDKLFEYILKSDIFYLFWSRAARDSQWVEKEWKYAYENKGIDFIDPVPLEPPELAPPPKPLSDYYHFNDWVLAFKSLSHWKDH